MVKAKEFNNKKLFQCDVCGHGYLDKKTAQECEVWCEKMGSCSVEITKKAVYFPSLPTHLDDIAEK
jgi:hypothetical protein